MSSKERTAIVTVRMEQSEKEDFIKAVEYNDDTLSAVLRRYARWYTTDTQSKMTHEEGRPNVQSGTPTPAHPDSTL